jgi:hypothetical protein
MWAWLLTILVLSTPSIYFAADLVRQEILRDDLRQRGVDAKVLDEHGECRSARNRYTNAVRSTGCTIQLSYQPRPEHGGEILHAKVSLLEEPYSSDVLPALYDPQNPNRVMLDSEVHRQLSGDEIALPIVSLSLPLLPVIAWIALGRFGFAAAARHPVAEIVPILGAVRVLRPRRLDVRFRRTSGTRTFVDSFMDAAEPLLVRNPDAPDSATQQWGLALVGRRGRAYLLDRALVYLDLTEQERVTILQSAW